MSLKLLRHDNSADFDRDIIISLDNVPYKVKPTGGEIGAITNRLQTGTSSHRRINIKELAKAIENGCTLQGSLLRDKQSDNEDTDSRFSAQQLFYIDIDNDYKDKESGKKYKSPAALDTPEQILDKARGAGLQPCIIAESFSSGKKDPNGEPIPKYHVCFASSEPVKDVNESRRIIENLMNVYGGQADISCKNPSRLLFGTTKDKQVLYCPAANTPEKLLNCSAADQATPAEPAPRAKASTEPSPTPAGQWNEQYKNIEAEPDILLQMIDTNSLSYEEFCSITASHKAAGGSDDIWKAWANNYHSDKHSHSEVIKANEKTRKGMNGKRHTIGTLKKLCQQYAPDTYNAYMQQLAEQTKAERKQRGTKSSKSNSAAGTIPQQPAPSATPAEQVEQWSDIKPFENTIDLQPFPLETLPKVLQDYVKAAAAYNSVYPEICILPMFAALSVCLQGKANVIYPGNGHSETLSLYCITIAAPGERKSSTNKLFMKPIKDYEQWYNTIHDSEIKEYNIKHKILENRLNKAIQKAGTTKDNNANEREALQLRADLTELEKGQKHPLNFTLQDVTPEALIDTLNENQERAAIVGDEATLFKILGGAYSGGKGSSGVNFDILLTSYDGEQYKVSRKGSGNIYLKAPLVTIGTMIQEQQFMQILENKDFVGKGFLQRFIFSKPRSNVGNIPFYSPKIPSKTAGAYKELIYSLLEKKQLPKPAELTFDKEAVNFIEYYHTEVQKKIRPGGAFSDPLLQEYASKQVAKVMKIAALLHLCEHSEGEPISGHTAMNAVKIGAWLETQAIAALNGEMQTDNERNARHIMKNLIKHIKSQKAKGEQVKELSKSKLLRLCRTINAEEADEALSYLDDMNAIRLTEIKTNGHPKTVILLNPAIIDFKF